MRPAVLCGCCAGMLTSLLLLSAGSSSGQDALRVSCLPEKAVALPGETVDVHAWVASDAGAVTRNVTVRWVVSAGRIDAQSPAARWLLEGADVDRRHTATVEVNVEGKSAGSCVLGVWIAADPSGGVRLRGEYITRRAFLRTGQVGELGFGLYSYFLMREPTNASDKARAESFVGAFLDVLVAVAEQENYVERRRLNGSYLPVTTDPPQGLTAEERTAWTLEHYDYDQAKRLLSLYPTLTGQGPFIVAVPAPLRSQVKPMLPWDFGQFDSSAIAEGVSRFLNQAAQLYDWQNQGSLQKLHDQVLTTVAGMFVGRATAERWMQIVR
jgi:hypothetical protein